MLERATGIEPASAAWKAEILPLNYARLTENSITYLFLKGRKNLKIKIFFKTYLQTL